MQAVLTEPVVYPSMALWNMRRMGRKSSANTPLQRARLRAGLRQEDVAEELNVQPVTVQRWETGQRDPGTKRLARLADLFKTSADELLGRQPPAPVVAPILPNETQLAEGIAAMAALYFPHIGELDREALARCSSAWRSFLLRYAEKPERFAAQGQTEFAMSMLASRDDQPSRRSQ